MTYEQALQEVETQRQKVQSDYDTLKINDLMYRKALRALHLKSRRLFYKYKDK